MVKEKGKEIEVTTGETEFGVKIPPELPLQEEPKPPTAEETLQKELVELRAKYEQADKGLRSAQATLTQKDRLLKEKENIRDEIDTLKNMVKILAVRRQVSESDTDEFEAVAKQKTPDIDKAFAELEQQQKTREYQNKIQEQIESYRQRVETLGLTEDNESYWEIYKLVTSATPADFKIADIKLKRMEKEKEITPVDNKPTDEKDKTIETLQKEVERLKKVASGELDSETSRPSGASATEVQIRKTFRENPHNAKARADYLELTQTKK